MTALRGAALPAALALIAGAEFIARLLRRIP
jgi:hypothetical protein